MSQGRGEVPTGLPRWVELPVALGALVAATPLLLLASIAIVVESGPPALFTQLRVGRNRRPLRFVKLRTMKTRATGTSLTVAGDARVTRCGRLLRLTKLDELPSLWHVVTGDMSLVGPRPEVPEFVDGSAAWDEVLSVRPGITDPVTVSLRHEEAYLRAEGAGDPERFYRERLLPLKVQGYRDYLQRRTWRTDLAVLAATAVCLLRVTAPARVPAPSDGSAPVGEKR